MLGRQAMAAGDPRFAGRAAAELAAFVQKSGAGGAVYGAIDAAAAQEAAVGGIDDGVHGKGGDVGLERAQDHR